MQRRPPPTDPARAAPPGARSTPPIVRARPAPALLPSRAMPRVLLALALLAACGAPELQPLHEAKRREPDKVKTPPEPEPEAPPAPPPEPYSRPGDPATQRDELRFWGFSADGLRYAFETFDAGPGAVKCEGEASLFIVDSERDTFVDGLPLILKHKQPDAERCDPPDLHAELARHRDELFHRHGIVVGNQGPAIVPRPAVTTRGTGRASTIDLPSGKQLRAELEVKDGDREKVGERGAAYRLTLAVDGDPAPRIVEDGERHRPWIWDYDLDQGLAFIGPDGHHMAILLGTTRRSFEGDRHSYMSNGLRLDDAWLTPPPSTRRPAQPGP